MNENETPAAEVDSAPETPPAARLQRATPAADQPADNDSRGELVKFGLLILVFLITFGVIALVAPIVGEIVPIVLGLDDATSAQPDPNADQPQNETPRPIDDSEDGAIPPDNEADNGENGDGNENGEEGADPDEESAAPPQQTHTVQPGQNLTMIARQYDVTVEAIIQANNLTNPDRIEAGTVLIIP
jgi:LysM repeat protein